MRKRAGRQIRKLQKPIRSCSPQRHIESLESRIVLDSTTVVNELMYAPSDGAPEWIELHNQMAVDMDLSGWSLANGIEYQFPEGTIIEGRGFLVVSSQPDSLPQVHSLGPFRGRLSNKGEPIELRDNNSRLMSLVDYRDDGEWPVGPDGSGASLAKLDERLSTEPADHWGTSLQTGGTPGGENFPEVVQVQTQVLEFDSSWRFDDAGIDRGNSWREVDFVDTEWQVGQGVFFDASTDLAFEGKTQLQPAQSTYYFRTTFNYEGGRTPTEILMRPIVDDGAVIYLNGHEILRMNMPEGPVSFATPAVAEIGDTLAEAISLPVDHLRVGQNVIAVELHQASTFFDIDIRNGSFEEDTTHPLFAPTNWEGDGFNLAGIKRVTQLDSSNDRGTNQPYPDGSQAIVLRSDDGEAVHIFQDVETISAGTYDLSFSVADRFVSRWLNYRIELLAVDDNGETLLFSADSASQPGLRPINGSTSHRHSSDLAGIQGDWLEVELQVHLAAQHAGKTLRLRVMTGEQSSGDTGQHYEFAIDNLRMSVDRDIVPDAAFGSRLDVVGVLPPPPSLRINEVAGVDDDLFFVELVNEGDLSIDLGQIDLSFGPERKFALPQQQLRPGEFAVFNDMDFGLSPSNGDRLFLLASSDSVIDARAVDEVARGLHPKSNDWLIVATPTPDRENQFNLHDQIAINEIMYHPVPELAQPASPGEFEGTPLVSFDSPWRYNASGADLGVGWQTARHPVAGDWKEGDGLIGFLPSGQTSPKPIGTELVAPADSRIRTYYFETDLTFGMGEIDTFEAIQLHHIVDDGAVIYVNGVEVLRHQMPSGPITGATFASSGVGDPQLSGPISLGTDLFVEGSNRLSVEVHQVSTFSIDVLFGLELTGQRQIEAPRPGGPFQDSSLEWIELYNKSDASVDLTGWRLDQAIQYSFSNGTMIAPGEYLVVASDLASMQVEYPTLTNVVGNYNGMLSNRSDRIALLDDIGNPADEVNYFDAGDWDDLADGNGSSLELVDPRSDNSNGLAWGASDEAAKSEWQTYRYRGIPERTIPGEPTLWREFALGFLDGAGEAIIDDISVIEDPDGAARELIQNGSFDNGADHFRLLGNHQRSSVIDVDGNSVLHLVSSGATEYQGNQVETTFADNRRLQRDTEYEVSFRAKWLSGSQQINSRFYFNQLPKTTILRISKQNGTPGHQNSRFQANSGPTINGLKHYPVLPPPGAPISISVQVADPDGIADVKLWYHVDGDPWTSLPMPAEEDSVFAASIPGQGAGAVIHFYVEASDSTQTSSVFPRDGADSRALVQVDDGRGSDAALTPFRLVMLQDDVDHLHASTNVLSNERLAATVISGEDVYYGVGVRLKGSFVGRDAVRVGFNIAFNPDNLFRGVHDKVSVDRSTHANLGVDEIILKHTANRAGGIPSMYDDLIDFVAPRRVNTGMAALRMAGFDEVYLDSQFDNGSDGTMYEYEVLRWATTTVDGNSESLKRAGGLGAPNGYANVEIQDLGDDNEAYRWTNLIASNRSRDDYDSIIAMGKAFSQRGDALFEQTREILDIDEWMRTAAFQSLFQPADSYYTGSNIHNFRMYVRPDGKVLYMPWDWDSAFQGSARAPLVGGSKLGQIVRLPGNLRLYYGHMLDIVDRAFNADYLSTWTDHYGELSGQRFSARLSFVNSRSKYVVDQINSQFPPFPFDVTTPSGQQINDLSTVVQGKGWVDVREIRLAGTDEPLEVTWSGSPNADSWQVDLPLAFGVHTYTLEARDFRGNVIGTETIEIESTVSDRPISQFLRITEINYNPNGDDATEFIELSNISAGDAAVALDLSGVTISDGPSSPFVIPEDVTLNAGEYAVVVRDRNAFLSLYPRIDQQIVLGEFAGSLSNSGERIVVADTVGNTILDFEYQDSGLWPVRADGAGGTLVLDNPNDTSVIQFGDFGRWRGSTEFGGSPGRGSADPIGIVISEVLANTNRPQVTPEGIELFNATDGSLDVGGWYLSDSANELEKYRIPDGTRIQPGQYLVIRESEYNPTPDDPRPTHFGLSGTNGDDVWLVASLGNGELQFADDVHFGPSIPGESLSRLPDGDGRMARTRPTLGQANDDPLVGSVVVSEISYAPAMPSESALEVSPELVPNDLEFVELYNRSSETLDLSGMRIQSGIDFDFDANVEFPPDSTLVVVSFDPQRADNQLRADGFRRHYGIDDAVRLVGGFSGRLSNLGDHMQLTRPGAQFAISDYVVEDIAYDDALPWPEVIHSHDSLHRVSQDTHGAFAGNWISQTPTPGLVNFAGARPGDFNDDGRIDIRDVDLLWAQLRSAAPDLSFDLTGDLKVDESDRDHMIATVLGTTYGDANLDRRFDSGDFVYVFQFGEYEDATVGNSTWRDGDWNADGDFTTTDLVLAFQSGSYVANSEISGARFAATVDFLFTRKEKTSRTFVP